MNPQEVLIDMVGRIKRQLLVCQEIGLDSPFLSPGILDYHRGGEAEASPEDIAVSNDLEKLENIVRTCDRCKLSHERKNTVFGEGPCNARLVFVGEAPGMDEDLTGRPFVGKAGKLLTDIIKAMGLIRDEVYICNVIKCHPPGNRDPESDEVESCFPYLEAQISSIKPSVICTLGRVSAQNLIDKDFKITRERGQWRSFMGIPVMPTYHPAYLLRYPQAKRQVWEDMQEVMGKLGLQDPRLLKGCGND